MDKIKVYQKIYQLQDFTINFMDVLITREKKKIIENRKFLKNFEMII